MPSFPTTDVIEPVAASAGLALTLQFLLLLKSFAFACCMLQYGVPESLALVPCTQLQVDGREKNVTLDELLRLYTAMETFLVSESLQRAGVEAMRRLTQRNPQNCAAIAQPEGGLRHLYAAMDAHIGCLELQKEACVAFGNIAIYSPEAKRVVMADGGAIPRLERAKSVHSHDKASDGLVYLTDVALRKLKGFT